MCTCVGVCMRACVCMCMYITVSVVFVCRGEAAEAEDPGSGSLPEEWYCPDGGWVSHAIREHEVPLNLPSLIDSVCVCLH